MADSAATDIARAEALVDRALATSPRNPLGRMAKGHVLRAQGRREEAIPEYEAVIAFNRNWAAALSHLGWCKLLTGSIEAAIAPAGASHPPQSRDPYIGIWCLRIGFGHLLQSRIDQAITWFERACGANRGLPRTHGCLASAYGVKGWIERASAELAEAQRLSDGRYSSIARLKAAGQWGLPAIQSLFKTTYFAGLRRAGMPEE
jgi:tetratricopeptide (TPR) repeat protein